MGVIGNMPQFVNRKVETLENKDIDGGLASNQSRISLPRGTTAVLAALQPKAGMIAYDTTLNSLVLHDGNSFSPVAGGGGTPGGADGQVQYNSSGAFAADAGFTYDGAGGASISNTLLIGNPSPVAGNFCLNTNGGGDGFSIKQGNGALDPAFVFKFNGGVAAFQGTNGAFNAVGDIKINPEGGVLYLGPSQLIWPATDGSPNQVLSTDGAGNLGWITSSAVGGAGAIQLSDGAGGFTSEAGITAGGGAMSVSGGSGQNTFSSFSSASVNELFFGRAASPSESFVISYWPDAGPAYADLHIWGSTTNHLVLENNGHVGIGSSTPHGRLAVYNTQDGPGDTTPAIALRNQLQPTDYGFDIMHRTVTTGDLVINRLSAGVSTEAMRVRRDVNQIQIGQSDVFATGDTSALIVSGPSNSNVLTVRAAAGGTEGAFSMGSIGGGTPYAFIQGTDSALTVAAALKINNQGGELHLGNGAGTVHLPNYTDGVLTVASGVLVSTPKVKLRYTTNAGQAITNTPATPVDIVFEDSDYDNSGGAYNSSNGQFTAPRTGYYDIKSTVTIDHAGETGVILLCAFVDGTEVARGQRLNVVPGGTTGMHYSDVLLLTAGEVLTIAVRNETDGNTNLEAFGPSNFLAISELP